MTSPTITASPGNAMLTDPISIVAAGFAPGTKVRLASALGDDAGVMWRAHADYVADADGVVDVSRSPALSGTFTGVDPAGLFWSMAPDGKADKSFMIDAPNRDHTRGQPHFDPLAAQTITLTALVDGEVRAETSVTLRRLADGIEVIHVRDGRLRGIALRHRDRSKPRGAIMSLTGSGGGVEMGFAPALASIGYDVFSLAYFAYEDLPAHLFDIPLEYFEEGFEWMKREFGATRMAVQGASRGGEASLVLAAYLPHYVSGATPIVPMFATTCGWNMDTGELGPSWTYRGTAIPYALPAESTPMDEMKRLGETLPNGYPYAPEFRRFLDTPDTFDRCTIPIERANGPILMISGLEDEMWDCAWGSDIMVARLQEKGYKHPYKHLALRETGHWTPLPNTITTFTPATFHGLAKIFLACGGTAKGTAHWSRTMWDELVAHYERVFAG
jgi:acyl-coenzyme A thioesterase 1/2/4